MTKISNFGKQNSILGSVVPLAMFLLQPLSHFHDQIENVYESKFSAFLKDYYLTCKMATMMRFGRDRST